MAGKEGQLELFESRSDAYEAAERYYRRNPALLEAHERAAEVMQRLCGKVSARFLTEFARWMRFIGPEGMHELLSCYEGVVVKGDPVAAVPNATSPYLTRVLERLGLKVTKARSVMDS